MQLIDTEQSGMSAGWRLNLLKPFSIGGGLRMPLFTSCLCFLGLGRVDYQWSRK